MKFLSVSRVIILALRVASRTSRNEKLIPLYERLEWQLELQYDPQFIDGDGI